MYKVNIQIFKAIELDKTLQEERYFVIDDTIMQKLGLFTAHGFYLFDFAYRFGKIMLKYLLRQSAF